MSHEAFHGRLEDDRMITGSGIYALDWDFSQTAHAWFVRADRAHAEIVSIDIAAAAAHPGVILILTGEDMKAAGLRSLPVLPMPLKPGAAKPNQPFRPSLALGKVRFVGEPVVCIIAENQQTAMVQ